MSDLDWADRHALLDRLQARLADRAPAREVGRGGVSGVLVPLRVRKGHVEVVFTRRTEHLSSHPGEVSFPGGRLEDGDEDLLDAALRETEEEVGLPREHLDVAGLLTDYQPFRGPLILAYVAVLDDQAPAPYRASPEEVAEVLTVPIEALLDPASTIPVPEDAWAVDNYEARVWWDEERGDRTVHYWHLSEDTRIWGITGELLYRFLEAAFDWEPPIPARRISRLEEFLG